MAPAAATLAALPQPALQVALFAVLTGVLWGDTAAHRFWQRYLSGVTGGLTGREIANRLQVLVDIDRHGPSGSRPWIWSGPTLLMETVYDPLFSPAERAALRARFPQAELHTFHTRGHITALTRAPEYIAVMRRFLDRHTMAHS